jgi:hypothetical protein
MFVETEIISRTDWCMQPCRSGAGVGEQAFHFPRLFPIFLNRCKRSLTPHHLVTDLQVIPVADRDSMRRSWAVRAARTSRATFDPLRQRRAHHVGGRCEQRKSPDAGGLRGAGPVGRPIGSSSQYCNDKSTVADHGGNRAAATGQPDCAPPSAC